MVSLDGLFYAILDWLSEAVSQLAPSNTNIPSLNTYTILLCKTSAFGIGMANLIEDWAEFIAGQAQARRTS
jgi:hypothetical protein